MKRLVIAVDCDDVLVRTTPFFVDAYNKKYGTNATLAEARNAYAPSWQGDPDEVVARWGTLTEESEYKLLVPDSEEAKILKQLAEVHELHLVTARKADEREYTQDMLNRELPGVFTSMEFVGWAGSKGEVSKRIGADVLIDDSASHLHDAIRNGLPTNGALLFGKYPWNEAESAHEDVTHCHDWVAVKNVIDTLAEDNG
jgi:uncharacterized HAD superfamily protein